MDTSVLPLFVTAATWPAFGKRVLPHLASMAEGSGGRYQRDDIVAAIMAGRMQLWLALEGAEILCAMVTQVVEYPRVRAFRCIGVVGHRPRRWTHLMDDVKRAARAHFGCSRMEAFLTPGHERLLGPEWTPWHAMWECAI
ncbi:MAG: hypothetical protein KGL39_26320 [Patescibacteria group bacterium]|nr:hypothetical protein [Patescibacteria group bacterium]